MLQVQAVPKKKAINKDKNGEGNSEEMKPLTTEEKAQDLLPDLLSDAAKARTESIKLSSVPYAKELSDQLLAHASKLEEYYKGLKKAIENKEPEKQLKSLVQKITDANTFTEKAQAWWQSEHCFPVNCAHLGVLKSKQVYNLLLPVLA